MGDVIRDNTRQSSFSGTPKETLARAVSVAGHPFILVPTAALIISGTGPAVVLALSMLVVACVIFFQVRRGTWSDVDVSTRQQRPEFYAVMLAVTGGAAFLLSRMGVPWSFVSGTLVAIALLAVQMIANRWVKSSLHASFAAFVTGMVAARSTGMAVASGCIALAIAWSRVTLKRHTLLEVIVGLGLGACAAIVIWL